MKLMMGSRKHILLDGYNLSMPKGTGIATYTRNLASAIKRSHGRLSILYDLPARSDQNRNTLLGEVLLFDSVNKRNLSIRAKPWSRKLVILTFLLKSLLVAPRPAVFERLDYVQKQILKDRFPECDGFMNLPDIFNVSMAYFRIFKRRLKIRAKGVDIAHWTCPIPLQVIDAINIYTFHDLIPLKLPFATLDNKKYVYHLSQEICNTADQIVTVSEHTKRDLCETFSLPEDKVVNTYQSVDATIGPAEPEETVASHLNHLYGLTYKDYFVAVGSVDPRKNLEHLVEAYKISTIKKPLVIAGPLSPHFKEALAPVYAYPDEVSQSDIRFLNHVSRHNLNYLIQGAMAMVYPSLYEGFGLPILEAMQLGTPVIASRTSALPEVGGEAAIYVDPYSVESIKEALIQVAHDENLREEMRAKGLIHSEEFGFDQYVERICRLYESL